MIFQSLLWSMALTVWIVSNILRASFASESDVEDAADATVSLPRDHEVSEKRAIKLFELGPRLDLKLIKIQSGLCGGEVIHHEFGNFSSQQFY